MSVIQRIRDKGAWIMLVLIALALIAFILQDGLTRGGGGFSNSSTIGVVNGKKIKKEAFDEKLDMYSKGQDKNGIIPQLWNQEVQTILMEEEFNKLGLAVGSKELSEFLYSPQSPLARSQGFLTEAGQLDVAKVQQYFNEANKGKNAALTKESNELKEQSIQQLLYSKYQALLQQSAYVPTWMVEKQKAEGDEISSISYVYVPYTSIVDSTIKVSDDEINAYVKKNEKRFKTDAETRTFSYVMFDASANGDDSLAAFNKVRDLRTAFATTTDVKGFLAKEGTELAYTDAYVAKAKMRMPNADSIKNLAVGQTFGPYMDMNNYVVARMINKRVLPDSVKVRHILVKTEDREQAVLSDSIAKKRIDSVEAFAKAGADFNELVKKYSDDEGSKTTKGEYDFTASDFTTISKEFADVAFLGKAGDKKVIKVKNGAYAGYHYMEVISQKAIGEVVNVAYLAKPIEISAATSSAASTAALQFAAEAKNKTQFEETAKKLGKPVIPSQEIKEEDYTIPMFGQSSASRSVIRWVFEKDLGDIGEPTDIGNRYIIAMVTSINKKGLPSAAVARKQVEQFVKNEKKAKQIIDTKFKGTGLEGYAASSGVAIQRADSLSFASPYIPFAGNEPKFVGAAFNKDMQGGKVSGPIAGNSGVVALRIEGNIGTKAVATDNETVKQILLRSLQGIGQGSMGALRKAAKIEDNRMKMYY